MRAVTVLTFFALVIVASGFATTTTYADSAGTYVTELQYFTDQCVKNTLFEDVIASQHDFTKKLDQVPYEALYDGCTVAFIARQRHQSISEPECFALAVQSSARVRNAISDGDVEARKAVGAACAMGIRLNPYTKK